MTRRSQNPNKLVVGERRHFLISVWNRVRFRKRKNRTLCPSCHGDHTELVRQIEDEEGHCRKEEYLCHDCDCEWDWTHPHPFFRWRVKVRAPGWVKVE
jgi:hypothetical protein